MKILHVITGMRTAAGTSVFVAEVAREQVALGHSVVIVHQETWRDDIYPLADGVKLIGKREFINNLSKFDFDIVHIHGLWEWMLHVFVRLCRKRIWPIIWSPHGSITPWAMNFKRWKKIPVWYLWQKRDLDWASKFHVTAQCEEGWLRDWELSQPCVIAPLGVRINDLPTTYGSGGVLFVSRIHQKKGIELLLMAYARLVEDMKKGRVVGGKVFSNLSAGPSVAHPNAEGQMNNSVSDWGWGLNLVGPGDEAYVKGLKQLTSQLGIANEVHFVGPLYGEELKRAYETAKLFVLPTHSENFGSVVIEALAAGVPVICTKGAPWQELVTHDCGWWVDIGVEPIYNAMRSAISMSAQELHQMGLRGRQLVEEKYTWDAVSRKLLKGYESIINRGV